MISEPKLKQATVTPVPLRAKPNEMGLRGKGGAAERASFRRETETNDTELATTQVKLKRAQGECLGIRSRRRT